jgi:hypothetical protein
MFAVLLCLLPLVPLWHFDYLPLQDYPNHYARLTIVSNYTNSEFYRQNFSISFFKGISPLPYLALDLFVTKLLWFIETDVAMRAFLSLYFVLYVTGLLMLAGHLKLDPTLLLLINLPLSFSCFFHLGMLNFLFSIPLFLFGVLVVERYMTSERGRYILLTGFLSFCIYLTHLATLFVFCIFLLCRLFSRRLGARAYLSFLLALSLPLVFTANFLLAETEVASSLVSGEGFAGENLLLKLLFFTFNFYHFTYLTRIMVSVLFVFSIYVIVRNSSVCHKPLLVASAVLFLVYFVLPFGEAMNFLDLRVLHFSVVLFPISLKVKDARRVRFAKLMLLGAFALSFSWLWASFHDFNGKFSVRCAGQLNGRSTVLPVDATPERPVAPFVYSWGYFMGQKEFMAPYLFSSGHLAISYRDRPPAPNEFWMIKGRLEQGRKLLDVTGKYYDYILLIGRNPELEELVGSVSEKVCSEGWVSLHRLGNHDMNHGKTSGEGISKNYKNGLDNEHG